MRTATPQPVAFRFRLNRGSADIDCVVTKDAFDALGVARPGPSEGQRRFLEGIAAERLEWSRAPHNTIIIDAWDIQTHRQD
jgi:hypothetical protein